MKTTTEKILSVLGCDDFLLSLSFVTVEEISSLNKKYRKLDKPTDVLSFPQLSHNEQQEIASFTKQKKVMPTLALLGDVVICPEVAEGNCAERDNSIDDEITFLIIHSVLHLLGYDHQAERDARRMQRKEQEVLKAIEESI